MNRINNPLLILAVGLLCLTMSQGTAQAQTEVPVNYTWTAPTTGSPVVHYVVQQSINDGAWAQIATSDNNTFTLSATVDDSHRIRVAGVDAEDRQGPFSLPSDAFVPGLAPPGQPGKPILF